MKFVFVSYGLNDHIFIFYLAIFSPNPLSPKPINVRLDFFSYDDYKIVRKYVVNECFGHVFHETLDFEYLQSYTVYNT